MNYHETVTALDDILHPDECFDLIKRRLIITGNKEASLYYIDGMVKDSTSVRLFEFITHASELDLENNIPYVEVDGCTDVDRLVTAVLSGSTVLVADGLSNAKIIDTRTYPARGVSEPETDKVLRGARDGFTETLVSNTALIRRRIRDPNFTITLKNIGDYTRSDIAICYIKGRADDEFVKNMDEKLSGIKLKALNFAEESLAEYLIDRRWYNPFPKIRYTERPDAASAMLLEGSVIILCDNSPSAMILPTSIFDFLQESDDFNMPPLTSSYLRLLRIFVFLATLYMTPIWYLFVCNPEWIPNMFNFINIKDPFDLPIIIQLLILEVAIDGLKMASLNTPNVLNSSLSVVGGLILGDFAVKSGWFLPEVILYMAVVTIANFTQTSIELSYSFKFIRIILLLATHFFSYWGFIAATVLLFIMVATNKSVDGSRHYLYPLIPWNGRAMKRLLFRVKLDPDYKKGAK
jgi:stage V sporulation protein AF